MYPVHQACAKIFPPSLTQNAFDFGFPRHSLSLALFSMLPLRSSIDCEQNGAGREAFRLNRDELRHSFPPGPPRESHRHSGYNVELYLVRAE